MFNTPNPGNYKPPKNITSANTPSSSKRSKQGSYGTIQSHLDRMRDSSPSASNNMPRNVYNYQNILSKVAATTKKQPSSHDTKQLYSGHNSRASSSNSKVVANQAQASTKQADKGEYESQLKTNLLEKTGQKEVKTGNYLQETQNNTSSKVARPSSANHTSYKGHYAENKTDTSPLGENYGARFNSKCRNEIEKVISLIGKERKSRNSSPNSILRKNSKGTSSDIRSKESLDNKRSINKKVTLDFEEDLNSKTIENIIMPMSTTYSFSMNKVNNVLKGAKSGRNTPLDKSRQNSIMHKKINSRETLDNEYKNLILSKDETNNISTVTTNEAPIQVPGRVVTASGARVVQSELTTQRLNFLDNYHLQTQPVTLNDITMNGQEQLHQSNAKAGGQQLNPRNLNIQTTKENKTIDIAAFLKNFTGKKLQEKTTLSADSISSQIPNENAQVPDLPVTNQTRKASEGIQNILSSGREVTETPNVGSFASSVKNYFKGQRTRSENPHKSGERHRHMKIETSNDVSELEQTIKKLLNTSDNVSKRAYKRIIGMKPEDGDERLEVTKGYNFTKEEFDKDFKENLFAQNKPATYTHTPNNAKRAQLNETKPEMPQKQASPKNVSILSISAEEREAKKAIFKQDYSVGKELGRGAYAAVRCGTHKPSNMKVAIKIYQKEKISDPMRRKSVRREIKVMQRMNHPNIIKIFDTFETRNYVNIIMEYVDGSSLYSLLKAQPERRLKEKHAFRLFKQVVEGLDYCHTRCITHRDIKLENILLDHAGNVKLIDFGFTTCIPNDKKVKLFCGTPSYMAPEIVQRKEYCGPPVDIWALGVLLYVLLCGSFPFKGDNDKELYKAISKGEFNVPDYISDEAENLLRKILNVDADLRPTAKEISNDPWFVIHSFLEKKKASKHRRCVSAEKTKAKPSQIITNMAPEFLEIKNNNEGFINLNQFTTNVRAPTLCFTKDREDRHKEKSEEVSRRKRCQTPNTNHTSHKTKHFVFDESNGNKMNFRRYDNRDTEHGEMFGLEDTYDENKIMKRTVNEVEVWNNKTDLSDKSGKKEFGKSSLLNKTIAILNKSERRDDTMFRYDPEAIKNIINMGYTEEEIIKRLKEKSGIVFAIYNWMTKDNKLSQGSNLTDSTSSDSSGIAKTCYGMLSSNNTLKKKNDKHSTLNETSDETRNLYGLSSPNTRRNMNLKKDAEDLNNKWKYPDNY